MEGQGDPEQSQTTEYAYIMLSLTMLVFLTKVVLTGMMSVPMLYFLPTKFKAADQNLTASNSLRLLTGLRDDIRGVSPPHGKPRCGAVFNKALAKVVSKANTSSPLRKAFSAIF